MQTTLDLTADIIDIRDIIARIEELAEDLTTYSAETRAHPEWAEEHATLCTIMRDLKGCGGDEQWEGDWYPVTLIRDSHFTDYAQELVCDCYDLKGVPPFVHIDWEATAREVRMDYSATEIGSVTYWYR